MNLFNFIVLNGPNLCNDFNLNSNSKHDIFTRVHRYLNNHQHEISCRWVLEHKNKIFQLSITVDIFYFEGISVLYCFRGNFIPTCVLLKQHQSMVGGPNPSCCPICNKLCMSGEMLMEHMKFVHKDPNASGVPGEIVITIWSYRGVVTRRGFIANITEAFRSDPHDYKNLSISIRILFKKWLT